METTGIFLLLLSSHMFQMFWPKPVCGPESRPSQGPSRELLCQQALAPGARTLNANQLPPLTPALPMYQREDQANAIGS